MMKKRNGRFLALFLALTMALSLIPGSLTDPAARAETYGMVINSSVKLRREATSNSDFWFVLPVGWVCTIHAESNANGTHWYRVIAPHPDAKDVTKARTYWGYIASEYFRPLTDTETAEYRKNPSSFVASSVSGGGTVATPAASGTNTGASESGTNTTAASTAAGSTASAAGTSSSTAAASGTTGSITNGGTNFREGPGKKYHSIMKLDRGTVVNITSIPDGIGEDYWYGVSYAGKTGYVNSEFVRVLSGGAAARVTVSPTATPTPPPSTDGYNAVQLVLTSAHLRTSPNGDYNRDNDWEGAGSILPLNGTAVNRAGYIWYPVQKDGRTYYVRSDCVRLTSVGGTATAAPTATVTASGTTATPTPDATASTPTATPAPSSGTGVVGYVQTTKSGCNLRATMGGTTIKQIAKGVTLPYLSQPTAKGGYTWYYVNADGNRGYLRGDVVKVVSSSGSSETSTATAAPVTDENATGYVMTNASDVNLRTKAGYSAMIGRVARGVVMPYYGTPSTVNGVPWYHVYHDTLGYGYIHGSYVNVVNSDGSATPTPQPTAAATGVTVTASTSEVEASYSTLKVGATGTAVQTLVQALKNRGYYSGTVTSKYTTAVASAVRAFQRANNLSVDGIAGAATQHALYGTVPVGASASSALTMTLYPAEKIDWWTGGINQMWARGTSYKIYDVKTGIVWWARRWAGGYHVDAEPLTAADTARLCKAYGVTSASEIKSKNLYERRPSLVTIGNRTFACSLYGVPHNDDGDTIKDNDYTGQLCIHFSNSWTHGSKAVNSLHTEAIQYAWENAPNGHK